MQDQTNISFIDIVSDIIKVPYTGGRYKGEEVNKILIDKISGLSSDSLLVLDFQKANPLDYVFCQYAFGSILEMIQEKSKPMMFSMQPIHKRCFYRGVLKYINSDLPRKTQLEEMEDMFLESGLYTMIKAHENKNIEFIGKLSPEEESILKFINNANSVSERGVIDALQGFQPTPIIESLKSLSRKGFIISPWSKDQKYISVYQNLEI